MNFIRRSALRSESCSQRCAGRGELTSQRLGLAGQLKCTHGKHGTHKEDLKTQTFYLVTLQRPHLCLAQENKYSARCHDHSTQKQDTLDGHGSDFCSFRFVNLPNAVICGLSSFGNINYA